MLLTLPSGGQHGPRGGVRLLAAAIAGLLGMHHAQLTEGVRRLVADAFADLGDAPGSELRETILIRNGGYCGRRFETDNAAAIWFVEENQLKVFQADGRLVRVVHPIDIQPQQRAAA